MPRSWVTDGPVLPGMVQPSVSPSPPGAVLKQRLRTTSRRAKILNVRRRAPPTHGPPAQPMRFSPAIRAVTTYPCVMGQFRRPTQHRTCIRQDKHQNEKEKGEGNAQAEGGITFRVRQGTRNQGRIWAHTQNSNDKRHARLSPPHGKLPCTPASGRKPSRHPLSRFRTESLAFRPGGRFYGCGPPFYRRALGAQAIFASPRMHSAPLANRASTKTLSSCDHAA